MTEKDLQEIMQKAGKSMVQDGNLDINLAASGLRIAAEKFYYLLKYSENRPIQERYDFLMATVKPSI